MRRQARSGPAWTRTTSCSSWDSSGASIPGATGGRARTGCSACLWTVCEPVPLAPLAEQQQGVRGDGGVVGDSALGDHLLEPGPGHPGLAHVLLFALSLRRPWFQPGGQEEVAALAADAVGAVQEPELDQVAGAQPGFLRELEPGEFLRAARLPVREPALRERPGTPPDRVAEFLD